MNEELKQIKKIYGEEMMHLCRDLFPTILEEPGKLLEILKNNIAPTHRLATDIYENDLSDEFENFIYSFFDNKEEIVDTNKTPFELMDEAGYVLYECKSEKDIQKFAKYYEDSEVLCTIKNGGRLKRCYVFFAVKKNVDEIKRDDFTNPKREDEYGTSVISIQFSRGDSNSLSIKNRYNHTVNNPDATFNNNLENIIPGLTKSFENYYDLDIKQETNSSISFLTSEFDYVVADDGRCYRYNLEIDGTYYCENNIIITNGHVIDKYAKNPERYLLIDQFIVDLKEKTISFYDDYVPYDSFIDSINDIGKIEKINVVKKGDNRVITFVSEDKKEVNVEINKHNEIIGYENNYIEEVKEDFLAYNKQLESISLQRARIIGNWFLSNNQGLKSISLPEVITIGDDFLEFNKQLESILLPKVQIIKDNFLRSNNKIQSILLPQVRIIGTNFLRFNEVLKSIYLPNVIEIAGGFLGANKFIDFIKFYQEIAERKKEIGALR